MNDQLQKRVRQNIADLQGYLANLKLAYQICKTRHYSFGQQDYYRKRIAEVEAQVNYLTKKWGVNG